MSSEAAPRLLLVDDEQSITESLAPFLTRSGFDVDVAADGAAALRIIESRHPDIVVSDVVMPVVDGRELLRRLRRSGDTTPVILLTHVGESGERSAALDEGADDYLNKPFDPQELVSRSRAVLRRVAAGAGGLVSSEVVEADGLRLDRPARRVWRDGVESRRTGSAWTVPHDGYGATGSTFRSRRRRSSCWSSS